MKIENSTHSKNSGQELKIGAYDPQAIETKWQRIWNENKTYSPNLDKSTKPFYNLMMFPYPSAEGLHVGNMYAFTGSDIYGRYKRMQGYDVFEPMGLDGFGIHSENYALKVGKHPKEQAKKSEENFYRQLRSIGNGFDWERKVETYDPDYYQWTQWIFVQLFKKGLAYRKKSPVNFCPSCKTVLADEQVIPASPKDSASRGGDGKCERCSSIVEKRDLEQWFFKITDYAERLLSGLEKIDWSEKVKIAQKNWIGKSEGAEITFKVLDSAKASLEQYSSSEVEKRITVFTRRPDTSFGITFLVLAPEHPLVTKITTPEQKSHVAQYLEQAKKKSEIERTDVKKEKTGVFTGSYCLNPFTNSKIPIWVADYVIAGYGTGAVMGVPGSDHRDFEFAQKYGLSVIQVISKASGSVTGVQKYEEVLEEGYLVNSQEFDGLQTPNPGIQKLIDFLEKKGYGKKKIQFHLRDWLISRQRYWGPPIPMIFCPSCEKAGHSYFSTQSGGLPNQPRSEAGIKIQDARFKNKNHESSFVNPESDMAGWYPVPEKDLPVMLPDVEDWRPVGSGSSPLAAHPEFYETTCPHCGGKAKRETDVSDTFLDSAWYYLRYPSVRNVIRQNVILSETKDLGTKNRDSSPSVQNDNMREPQNDKGGLPWDPEITKKWLPVNMYIGGAEHSVLHLLYSRFISMFFKDLGLVDFEEPFTRFYAHGLIIKDGAKMSKSKGNVVVPDEYIKKLGADTLRAYLMFTGPYNMGGDFRDSGVEGMNRFIKRVWTLCQDVILSNAKDPGSKNRDSSAAPQNDNNSMMHKTIKRVTDDMEGLRYNTAIAGLMEYYNFLSDQKEVTTEELKVFLQLLSPFAPHMTEELWEFMGQKGSIHVSAWPEFDASAIKTDSVTYAVQINGKVRETLRLRSGQAQNEVEELARSTPKIAQYLSGQKIKQVIHVPGKVINFVTD